MHCFAPVRCPRPSKATTIQQSSLPYQTPAEADFAEILPPVGVGWVLYAVYAAPEAGTADSAAVVSPVFAAFREPDAAGMTRRVVEYIDYTYISPSSQKGERTAV